MRFELYKDVGGEWRWRLKAGNGEVVADSAEGYKNRTDCLEAIEFVRNVSEAVQIVELDGSEKGE